LRFELYTFNFFIIPHARPLTKLVGFVW